MSNFLTNREYIFFMKPKGGIENWSWSTIQKKKKLSIISKRKKLCRLFTVLTMQKEKKERRKEKRKKLEINKI